jgi:hypothetical protein
VYSPQGVASDRGSTAAAAGRMLGPTSGEGMTMKAVYRVEATTPIPVSVPPVPVNAGGVPVEWEVEEAHVIAMRFTVAGAQLQRDPTSGAILTATPELEAEAFRIVTYVANSIFIQTGLDAFDPYSIVGNSALDVMPETAEEDAEFQRDARRTATRSVRLRANVSRIFDPSTYTDNVENWPALADYADALRMQNPFLKYEQLYKVVEYFSGRAEGAAFDHKISAMEPSFTEREIGLLRELRNRSIHAEPRRGTHLSPQNIQDVGAVLQAMPRLQVLAWRLLQSVPK